jgi:hypothetical protein
MAAHSVLAASPRPGRRFGAEFRETEHVPADASADRAELSALTTAVEELTKRITLILERYSGGARDDVLAALEGAERALIQASRRLDVATRALKR